jgi:hypothetical protein
MYGVKEMPLKNARVRGHDIMIITPAADSLSIHLPIYPSTYLPIHPSIHPSTHPPIHPPIHLPTYLRIPVAATWSIRHP